MTLQFKIWSHFIIIRLMNHKIIANQQYLHKKWIIFFCRKATNSNIPQRQNKPKSQKCQIVNATTKYEF